MKGLIDSSPKWLETTPEMKPETRKKSGPTLLVPTPGVWDLTISKPKITELQNSKAGVDNS